MDKKTERQMAVVAATTTPTGKEWASEGLLQAATEIAQTLPSGDEMAFAHAVLCQVGLPRSKVVGDMFERRSGSAWVVVQAGYLDEGNGKPVKQLIPYGVTPRLALAWVTTYAVRYRTREIPIGRNASEFLELMGIGNDSGRRYRTLRSQMHALAACRLQLGFMGRTFNGQPVEGFDAWVPRSANKGSDIQQSPLWPRVMTLSENYFSSLMNNGAVPLDNRALSALNDSALALDVYAWLAQRLHKIQGSGKVLHWKALRDQFGQEYTGEEADKNFKRTFLVALRKVLAVYPQARVKQVQGGVLLMGSPPPIAKKPVV